MLVRLPEQDLIDPIALLHSSSEATQQWLPHSFPNPFTVNPKVMHGGALSNLIEFPVLNDRNLIVAQLDSNPRSPESRVRPAFPEPRPCWAHISKSQETSLHFRAQQLQAAFQNPASKHKNSSDSMKLIFASATIKSKAKSNRGRLTWDYKGH
jgi:hypothetical protein